MCIRDRYKHNTFQAVFYDADQDGDEDLIVAHDTGQVRTWKNNGDMKFENVKNPNSDVYSYPMESRSVITTTMAWSTSSFPIPERPLHLS